MHWIGLLTHPQKQAGFCVSQDADFIYLWHGRDGAARLIAVFLFETATVKEIREAAENRADAPKLRPSPEPAEVPKGGTFNRFGSITNWTE